MATCANKIGKLVNHKRNAYISLINVGIYGDKAFSIKDPKTGKQTLYPGLTKKLKRVFYPEIEENPMKKNKQNSAQRKHAYYKASKQERSCPKYGKDHGKQVHQELELYTNMLSCGKKIKDFTKSVPIPDPCTIRIITMCARKGWYPLVAEQMIWDEDMRVATAIDMIVTDVTTGKLILLELKTGYEGEEYGPHPSDGKFPEPLNDITNCPMFRHMLQVTSMLSILYRKYKVTIDDAYIVRAMSKERRVECISMPKWCRIKSYRDNVYDMMCIAENDN
jgi:hypothetical protein